jgi:hypothetical protein
MLYILATNPFHCSVLLLIPYICNYALFDRILFPNVRFATSPVMYCTYLRLMLFLLSQF